MPAWNYSFRFHTPSPNVFYFSSFFCIFSFPSFFSHNFRLFRFSSCALRRHEFRQLKTGFPLSPYPLPWALEWSVSAYSLFSEPTVPELLTRPFPTKMRPASFLTTLRKTLPTPPARNERVWEDYIPCWNEFTRFHSHRKFPHLFLLRWTYTP